MYLYLGSDKVVRSQDVLGIFDIENTSVSKFTREFLNRPGKNHEVFNVSYEMPKSFILCQEKEKTVIYISQISPQTLLKRANQY